MTGQTLNMNPSCNGTTDPDEAPRVSLDPGCQHGLRWQCRPLRSVDPGGNIAHGHQHSFRLQHRPQTSTWFLVVAQAMDINTDPGYSRITDPDMASADPDIINMPSFYLPLPPLESSLLPPTPPSVQHSPWSTMWLQTAAQPKDITCSSVVIWATNINRAPIPVGWLGAFNPPPPRGRGRCSPE